MPDLTFIIPIAPHHTDVAKRAINSVMAQTIDCKILTLIDHDKRGPGVLRNAMLAKVETSFVSFLDADDWIEMTFAEELLNEYHRIGGNRYIYPDWIDSSGNVYATPCLNGANGQALSVPDQRPYCGGTWHPITTLIPTDWAKAVNGFDDRMSGAEDTEFYLKLCTTYRCGHRLARPLFHYSSNGGRALEFRNSAAYHDTMKQMTIKYGGKMGCCGDNTPAPPIGEKQPGDVLAMTLWNGRRHEHSRFSNRTYPRTGNGALVWVDPRDVVKCPNLWRLVEQPKPVDKRKSIENIQQLAGVAMRDIPKKDAPEVVLPEPPVPAVNARPDIGRVIALADNTANKSASVHVKRDPIFVFYDKDYPSYYDIKRLVELSGYEIRTFSMDAFSEKERYIMVSPDCPPAWTIDRPNIIAWQLEYAGDYTNNYDGFKGEIWASDKAWADQHGARYVLMGSDPKLAYEWRLRHMDWEFDLTMLGYMTPRRQSMKDSLSKWRWPIDYPGHNTALRGKILWDTRLMLHVHQHDNAPFVAPQRFALAAAYSMPMISETVKDAGLLSDVVGWADYENIPMALDHFEQHGNWQESGNSLHEFLCLENQFRSCVEKALRS